MNLTGKPPSQKPQKCPLSAAAHRAYVGEVKQLPCAVCGAPGPSDAHHVICGRYGTSRPCDCQVIPLCKKHHQHGPDAIHNGKASWVEKYGNDYDYLEQTRAAVEDRLLGECF